MYPLDTDEFDTLTNRNRDRKLHSMSLVLLGSLIMLILLIWVLIQNATSQQQLQQTQKQIENLLLSIQDQHNQQDAYLQCLLALDTHQPNAVANCPPPNFGSFTTTKSNTNPVSTNSISNPPISSRASSTPPPQPTPPTPPQTPVQRVMNTVGNLLKGLGL